VKFSQGKNQKIIPPSVLLEGYSLGIFPMSDSRDDEKVNWYTAERRGIIPMDEFHVSSNVQRKIRNDHFDVTFDHEFREVMLQCANRNTTWISDLIIDSFCELHERGYGHSVEVYDKEGNLVGGLYGVELGAAFFGESMFNYEPETAKIALAYCHRALVEGGFELWDTQFYTEHLSQFGCMEIPSTRYKKLLQKALKKRADFKPVSF